MKSLILFSFGILFSVLSWAQIPATNLRAEYKFKFGSLTDRISGVNLVQTGTALTGTPDRANGVNTDRAISLNGDHLQRTAGTTGNTFSVSFWIKTSTNDANVRVIMDQSERANSFEGPTETGWYAYLKNGTIGLAANYEWYRWNTSGYLGWHYAASTTNIADGLWHHVTITNRSYMESRFVGGEVVGNTYKIYIDNTLSVTKVAEKALGAVTGSVIRRFITPSIPITIGNSRMGNSTRFEEAIDDIRYYNAVLTVSDVTQLYNEVGCAGVTGIAMLTQDLTITLNASGSATTITPDDIDNGSVNSCSEPVTLSLSKTSFGCDDLGENTVTLYAEDDDGNKDSTTAIVTVKPTVTVPVPTSIVYAYLDADGNGSLSPRNIINGISSSCGTDLLTMTFNKTEFTCADLGVNTNDTLIVSDGFGTVINRTVTVSAEDTISPTAIAQNIVIQLDSNGVATITPVMIDNGSTDNCTVSLSLSKTRFSCEDTGENTVILTATDSRGNTNTATAIVTVVSIIDDEELSTLSTSFCTDGSTGGTVSTASSTVGIDYYLRNSEDNSIVDGPLAGTGSALDFNTGNLSQTTTFNVLAQKAITATITTNALDFDGVNDKVEIPFVNQLIGTSAFTIEAWIHPTKTTFSRIITRFVGGGSAAGDVVFDTYGPSNNGRGLRLYLARSNSVGVNLIVDNVLTLNSWNHVAATFNSGTMALYVNGVQVATEVFGESTVVSTTGSWVLGEDRAGTIAEFFTGKMDEVRFWNVARTTQEILDNMNACELNSTTGLTTHYTFDNTASTTLTDNSGNGNHGNLLNMDANTDWVDGIEITCPKVCDLQMSTEITIGDITNPTAIAQNITIQLDSTGMASISVEEINNGSTDNCTADQDLIISLSKTTFDCTTVGENIITLTVLDSAGNMGETTAIVTVEDNIAPIAFAKNIIVYLDSSGVASIQGSDVDNGSIDNCIGVANLIINQSDFSCADLGENEITFTVEDASGNQSSVLATVTVLDTIAPSINTQDLILELDANGNASLTAEQVNNGSSDNCSSGAELVLSIDITSFSCENLGPNTVTFSVSDASGNTTTDTVTVSVEDNLAPTVITKNIIVKLDNNDSTSIAATDINDGSSDNCTDANNLTYSIDVTSFNLSNVGDNVVTLTVSDSSGNSGTANAMVTIEAKTGQTITFNALESKTFGDPDFDLTATASSLLDVTYTVISGPITISGNTVSITGTGSVTIEASQAGDLDFKPATSVQQVFNVLKADQTISFEALPAKTFGDDAFDFAATASSGLEVSYTLISGPATLSGKTISITGAGSVTLEATQAGNDNYNSADTVQQTLTINKADQTISFEAVSDKTFGDASFDISASASSSLEIIYTLVSGPATLSGQTISITGAGSVTIEATQSGNDNYNSAAAVQQTFTVQKANQTITLAEIGEQELTAGSIAISANASSGLEVGLSISGPATLNNTTITFTGEGMVTLTANQSGNENYNPAVEVIVSFEIVDNSCNDFVLSLVGITDIVSGNDGAVDILVTGGSTPYTFNWSNGATTEDLNNVDAGEYSITVSDFNDCVIEDTFTVGGEVVNGIAHAALDLNIYPNPSHDYLTIHQKSGFEKMTVQLINIQGQLVRQYELQGAENYQLDISQEIQGTYFLKIEIQEEQKVYKIQIE